MLEPGLVVVDYISPPTSPHSHQPSQLTSMWFIMKFCKQQPGHCLRLPFSSPYPSHPRISLFLQRLRSQEEPYLRARSSKSRRLDSTGTEPQRYTNVSVTDRLASQSSEATTSSGLGRSIYYNSSTPNSQVTLTN